jgi:hypothetical protein
MTFSRKIFVAVMLLGSIFATPIFGSATLPRYFAHQAVEDKYGVIAPWYNGQNGQFDFRVRVAADVLKRYPWVNTDKSVMAGPHYVFNPRMGIDANNGAVKVLEATDTMNGNVGQRFKYLSEAAVKYYRYSGDPFLIGHLQIISDYILDYCLTDSNYPWPGFPISVPWKGKPYGQANEKGYIQLDLSAGIGLGMIRTFQLTGERQYLDAAKRWGDIFAEKCNYGVGAIPWDRYAGKDSKCCPWDPKLPIANIQTGGVANILIFLDELIRLGYTGHDGAIIKARDAGRAYLHDRLLDEWYKADTWGRHYWDWDHPVQGILPTGWVAQYLMDHKDLFPNWKNDVRNILSMYLNHACVNPESNGGVYSGAWSYPEGPSCCGRSLDMCPIFLSCYFARYGVETESEWGRELARRQIMLGTYHFRKNGIVEDNIDGGLITASEWSELVGMGPVMCVLDTMQWLPEVIGPARENHIMRSSTIVTEVCYGEGDIRYQTFDAPANTIDVLRLAFKPKQVKADGKKIKNRGDLSRDNGFMVKALKGGDYLVTIRHDGCRKVNISGRDPQVMVDDAKLTFEGAWQKVDSSDDYKKQSHITSQTAATASLSFSGNQVRLVGSVGPKGGLADVYIDGVKQLAGIDYWNQRQMHQQILYYRNGLSNEKHTLKIMARGEKNFLSQGKECSVDAVQYSAATGASDYGQGGGPKDPQRWVFGYTERQPYTDHRGKQWLPGTEFVVRGDNNACDTVARFWITQPNKNTIEGTSAPELYRYGVHGQEFAVYFTVAPDKYRATLKFAQPCDYNEPQKHTVTIRINGKEVAKDIDIKTAAGGINKAVDLVYKDIEPSNGVIEIRFVNSSGGQAQVQAIEIEPQR